MRRRGYQLTRFADDWAITCESAAEARAAIAAALRILSVLDVQLHPQKTRVVHVRRGFEFLGYKIKRGRQLRLRPGAIRSGARSGALYAYPKPKSIRRFMDQVRQLTRRSVPLTTKELIDELNPVLRGGAITISGPTSERCSSTDLTRLGSCAAFGRTGSESAGDAVAGYSCRKLRCTESTGL